MTKTAAKEITRTIGQKRQQLAAIRGEVVGLLDYLLARSEEFRGIAIKSMSGASGRQRVQEPVSTPALEGADRVDALDLDQQPHAEEVAERFADELRRVREDRVDRGSRVGYARRVDQGDQLPSESRIQP